MMDDQHLRLPQHNNGQMITDILGGQRVMVQLWWNGTDWQNVRTEDFSKNRIS